MPTNVNDDDDSKPIAVAAAGVSNGAEGGIKEEEGTTKKGATRGKSAKKSPVKSSAGKTTSKRKYTKKKIASAPASKKYELDDNVELAAAQEEDVGKKVASGTKNAIPFTAEEFPQLTIDNAQDYTNLATSFKRPLFDEPSRPLEIAYSQQAAAKCQRQESQRKKNVIVNEYNALREKLLRKKLELSLADDDVRGHSQIVGAWTRKVFDLELEEDCQWNTNVKKLKAYKEEHGKLPPHPKKAKGDEEKYLSAWLDRVRSQRTMEDNEGESEETPKKKHNKNKKFLTNYPHRLECLSELGVVWENHNENRWETMFQKLLIYKEEQGTLRFPSEDQCAATGDDELIALQKWIKSQVLSFRYGKKRDPEIVKRLLDIGFDFEKWYGRPGKVKTMKGEKIAKFNDIAKKTVDEAVNVDDDRKMPAKMEEGHVSMEV